VFVARHLLFFNALRIFSLIRVEMPKQRTKGKEKQRKKGKEKQCKKGKEKRVKETHVQTDADFDDMLVEVMAADPTPTTASSSTSTACSHGELFFEFRRAEKESTQVKPEI
jgi:hypothetical protein